MTRVRPFLLLTLSSLLLLAGATGLEAQTCASCIFLSCHAPATAPPNSLWGELEPADNGVLPSSRDTSDEDDYANPEQLPRWVSVDPVQEGASKWLFALTNYRLQIWNLNNDPGQPARISDVGLSNTGLFSNVTGHTPQVFTSVRAAPDNAGLIAVGAQVSVGVGIFRTSEKSSPSLRYQDGNKSVQSVHTARLGASDYAFAAGDLGGIGVRAYNMTAANALGSVCHDNQPGGTSCPGVHLGGVGTYERASSVSGTDNFLVMTSLTGFAAGGFAIYDVSTPTSPVNVMNGLAGTNVYWSAMWREGSKYYLALRLRSEGRIYDVSCIGSGACSAPSSPVWSLPLATSSAARVSFSRSNGTPILYWSRGLSCGNGTTGELLYDVTLPATPHSLVNNANYWRHYYWDTATGFNYFAPTEGRFLGSYFYRAAWSVLDAHVWGGGAPPVPPTIGSVSVSPNPASVCQNVTFTGNSVTNGAGGTYEWEVRTDAGAFVTGSSGVDLNPFVWNTTGATPGQYFGRLVVENVAGPSAPKDSALLTVNGLTPLPGAGTFAPTKVSDSSGAVTFDVVASGATEWSWDFGEGAGYSPYSSDPINGPRPTHVYSSTGSKTVKVRVRNCAEGPVESASLVIDVPVVNPLVASFAFAACAFQLPGPTCQVGTGLSFVDSSTGAQLWDYDWDCRSNGSGCNSFEDAGHGAPVDTHTYTSAGTYTPQLRVRRGVSDQHVFTHSAINIEGGSSGPVCGNNVCESGETSSSCPADCSSGPVCGDGICALTEALTCPADCGGGGTASVTISGPTAGNTNVSYSFTASANNCTPAPNGWVWSHTGSGSSTSSSISILWATAGTKSISVSNSGCIGALDSHAVAIAGANQGALAASFSYNVNGLQVSFDATSSQGSPTAYLWNFGDGQTGEGQTVQHTYAAAGSYSVTLSVSRQDPTCPFGLCNSDKTLLVTVGGAQPPPEPPPPPVGLCQPDADTFCALGGDFKVEVDWEKKNGQTGTGKVVTDATSSNTGIFYFFDAENWELLLKVLDGCVINQHYWVLGGAATNVKYQIRVTDLVTEDVWVYDNPQGKNSDAITDTLAFSTCGVDRGLMRANAAVGTVTPRISLDDPSPVPPPTDPPPPSPPPPADVGPCDPDDNTLCTVAERFRVKVSWETKKGMTGVGTVVPQVSDTTGVFWFFEQDNWELLIKVLNGCSVNERYWVFGAGATDVRYVLTVEDLESGATWEYENEQGRASPAITDTQAFDTCP